jgi:hypothetical protein
MPRIGGAGRATSPLITAFDDLPGDYADAGLPEPANDIDVDLTQPAPELPDEYVYHDGEVTEAEEDPNNPGELAEQGEHMRNLAEDLSESDLTLIGQEIVDLVEGDIEERRPWREKFERGLEMMGLVESDLDDGPFPGASNVVHPLLVEAVAQFWARSYGELFPPSGPVKVKVMGKQTEETNRRAERVKEYLNYELTIEDEGYMAETARLLWAVPFSGCGFRKTFRDPVLDRNVGVYVPAEDMIVPAEATNLKTSPRFTHRMKKSANDVLRLQLVGHYRRVTLAAPTSIVEDDDLQEIKDEAGLVEDDHDDESAEYEVFECCIDTEIPGDEHMGEDGQSTGLKRPYVVSVERRTGKVLSIYRNWDEDDPLFRRQVYFEKYGFLPGFGYYDYGLFHLIGGLQQAATGALRVLLDSAASASLSGGFISKNANLKGKNLVSSPGQWQPVDATSEDLQKAFFPLPVKEPSGALFQLLGFLQQAAQRFTATTELMTGGADPQNAPVGTTNMMIEQGGKVMSSIHRRMHEALGRELRLRYDLCRKYSPEGGYPYDVGGEERTVYADDFAPGLQVIPVSDPSIFTSEQRLAQAQGVWQIATTTGVVPVKKAARRLLEAMKVSDIDDLIPDDPQPVAYDPMGEIQALLLGKPIMVTPEQPHVAHVQVLAAFANNQGYGANKVVMQAVGPQLQAVIGQHLAYAMATAARQQGVPVQYMDPGSGQLMPDHAAQMPGQMPGQLQGPQPGPDGQMLQLPAPDGAPQGLIPQNNVYGSPPAVPPEQIAQMLAQIAPALQQAPGLPGIDPNGQNDKSSEQQLQLEAGKAQIDAQSKMADIQMRREKHDQDMAMAQEKLAFERQKLQQKSELESAQADLKMQTAAAKAQADVQATQMKGQLQANQMAQEADLAQRQAEQTAQLQAADMARQQAQSEQEMALSSQQAQQDAVLAEQKQRQQMVHGEQNQQIKRRSRTNLDQLR